ncbi:MAG: FkbM family methyltransferase [Geminicoccaceae bacterium]|nr:FkbM family methyltransferase [Geminicoccaceae bacterium]
MKLLRRFARRLGFELVPLGKAREPARRLVNALERFAVDLVVDGGANEGQYARLLRASGWRGPILSIEPIPELRARLARRASSDPLWTVAPAFALGPRTGEIALHVFAETDMSSVLAPGPVLARLSPALRSSRRVSVPMIRLDELEPVRSGPWRRIFLKLDVQGYEAAVLDGAAALWPRIVGVQLELSLVPLYEGETDWRGMIDRMAGLGYVPWLFLPGYVEPGSARELQMDGIFFREDALPRGATGTDHDRG